MQNKGAITVLAIILALASIYQLSFTFFTWNVKKDAEIYAKGDFKKERTYLDSIAKENSLFRYSRQRELNLGLDLKGGMNVILEVSVADLVKSMANYGEDSVFNSILALAKEKQKGSTEDFITLFEEAFNEKTKEGERMVSFFINGDYESMFEPEMDNETVIQILRNEARAAIDNSINVIRTRIDRFGVVQPTIQKLDGYSGRILIELPGIKDPVRVKKLLRGTANLEFWETHLFSEIYSDIYRIDQKLIKEEKTNKLIVVKDTATVDTSKTDTSSNKSILNIKDSTQNNILPDSVKNNNTQNDADTGAGLNKYLRLSISNSGKPMATPVIGYASDTSKINAIFKREDIKSMLKKEVVLAWSKKPATLQDGKDYYELIALKSVNDGKPALSGDVVSSTRAQTDPATGRWEVSMTMNSEGTGVWANVTGDNVGRPIAIVLDGDVYSYPNVNSKITGGSSSISGNFSQEEATDLANILKSGKLQAPAKIVEDEVVGASLGEEAIKASFLSFIIAFVIVLIYMVFFYKSAGFIADIALVANIFFIFGVLASLGAALTLPGTAGIVLTIGMSVDANVLIYERIKEELKLDKGIKLAIQDGYKQAYSAIIDANITTLITGIVLYMFGHGPIKGFATTLIIGILTSLFAAIFITRIIIYARLNKKKTVSFYTKRTENAFKNTAFKFIEKRKIAYVISGIIIAIGIGSFFTNGLNLGVDFKGGRTYVVQLNKEVKSSEIAKILKHDLGGTPEVKTYGSNDKVKIITDFMIDNDDVSTDSIVESTLYHALKPYLNDKDLHSFRTNPNNSSRKVGPTIADDIKVAAVWSMVFALLAIFLYIFVRFRNWQFGLGALAALTHDVLIVLGIFSIFYKIMPFSMEVNQAFIAALLTVVGYSVNDTVVVFDRIREYLKVSKTKDRKDVYNDALNSTLSRTVNTSVSTFIVLLAIFIFGGDAISGFVFALLVGVAVGTYSSLFVATPVVYDTVTKAKVDKRNTSTRRDYTSKKKKEKEENEAESEG